MVLWLVVEKRDAGDQPVRRCEARSISGTAKSLPTSDVGPAVFVQVVEQNRHCLGARLPMPVARNGRRCFRNR